MSKRAVVVIPIYKEELSQSERKSFAQALKIFDPKKIILFGPHGISLKAYETAGDRTFQVRYFDAGFFKGVAGYNKLLLSRSFYKAFDDFEFMLIYQLDAWVFSDQLDSWCDKNYSYIGAPWFENFSTITDATELWAVGNGGFSLRKIEACLDVLDSRKKVFSFKFLWAKYHKYSPVQRLMRLPKMLIQFFFRNNTSHLYELFGENEDHFWSFHAEKIDEAFKVSPIEDALDFAFECNPRRMYELNQNKIPFGIHAWEKYDHKFVEEYLFKA